MNLESINIFFITSTLGIYWQIPVVRASYTLEYRQDPESITASNLNNNIPKPIINNTIEKKADLNHAQ
ncbi:hypothetical protein ELY21_07745 [Legionella sp. km535]|uniref:hypothetical protein n=1 Tax=Legionella sp. km535 TaxID=2498107 RepID=UPI000F8E7869|nr:hypothetical protein [Legionella sp. km535]RUR18342.1 hypothetical protein ELY21_07745 [Legionella sp. km535]